MTQSPVIGSSVTLHDALPISLTAHDASENTAGCDFIVHKVDQTPPSITCPVAQTLVLDEIGRASCRDSASLAMASDTCAGAVTVTQSPVIGSLVSDAVDCPVS